MSWSECAMAFYAAFPSNSCEKFGFYSDIWWCSTAVAVVSQASYFVCASYFDRKPMK